MATARSCVEATEVGCLEEDEVLGSAPRKVHLLV